MSTTTTPRAVRDAHSGKRNLTEYAIALAGGPTKVATLCRCNRALVYQWITADRISIGEIEPEGETYLEVVAAASGIDAATLRPDIARIFGVGPYAAA